MKTDKTADLITLLDIPRGVTAIIGGGGKTTLMEYLADRLPGTVLLSTTTHIRRPDRFPTLTDPDVEEIGTALERFRAVCVGRPAEAAERGTWESGKLTAPRLSFPTLAGLADYTLVEADGSRGLPLKAHAPWEPVIPENAARVVLAVGLDGIGKPVREACHRPAIYAALSDVTEDAVVTPLLAARVITAERYGDCVFLNKAESREALRNAEELAACLRELRPGPVICGSLRNGTFRRLL